ncbi:YhdH/YhfP family quinone oxidoreductase [Salinibius halmophilus]|uniref:YhdH/YhfP family quinone oxidoreductase n=1 Tax=Salinibius halmophilus TaxID=1853216 RepID=UPI000E667C8A|nr:YhdH/YhfP family quinone oxidoreductase [Salinibius halmophilus]
MKAVRVSQQQDQMQVSVESMQLSDLPDHEVLIKVHWSSINYKDAMSAAGNKGITRSFPHTTGLDAAGEVVEDASGEFQPGEQVVVIGYDLGMNTWGGHSQYIRVPASWPVRLPEGMSGRYAMALGTAGLTAGYCLDKLLTHGYRAEQGPILVSGATGGVGSVATMLCSQLGYHTIALTGKADQHDYLKQLGASDIWPREQFKEGSERALMKPDIAAAIDVAGGEQLVTILKRLQFDGAVAACGIIDSPELHHMIFPFILRGTSLLGVASADAPRSARERMLAKFAGQWALPKLEDFCDQITLDEVPEIITNMIDGSNTRRIVVKVSE